MQPATRDMRSADTSNATDVLKNIFAIRTKPLVVKWNRARLAAISF